MKVSRRAFLGAFGAVGFHLTQPLPEAANLLKGGGGITTTSWAVNHRLVRDSAVVDQAEELSSLLAQAGSAARVSGVFTLDRPVVLPPSLRSLELTADCVIQVRGDHSAFERNGAVSYRESLTSAPDADKVGVSGAYSPGQYLLLSSYDTVPGSNDKYGYIRRVIERAPGLVTVESECPRPLVSQPRASLVELAPSIEIFGQGQILSLDPTVTRAPLISLFAVNQPTISGIHLHESGGTGIRVVHCVGGNVSPLVEDLLDDGTRYFGYGVDVAGATRDLTVGGAASRVRHAVTTNTGPSLPSIGPVGEPENCRFEIAARDCSDKAIDTHRIGWGITIIPDVVGGSGGVQIRADNTKVTGGRISHTDGPGVFVAADVSVAPTIENVTIEYLGFAGTALLCKSAVTVRNPTIRDCIGGNIELASDSLVEGGSIVAGNTVGVRFIGSGNTVRGLQLGASTSTPFTQSSSSTRNTFVASEVSPSPLPAPTIVSPAAIEGSGIIGQQLKARPGTWNVGNLSFSFSWWRDGSPIQGAVYSTYTPVGGDAGTVITVRVVARRAGYVDGVTSAKITAKTAAALVVSSSPSLSGASSVGSWVTLSNGVWEPGATSWSYEWLIDGTVVEGANGNRLQLSSAWSGKSLAGRVRAHRSGWQEGVASSAVLKVAPGKLAVTTSPKVSGDMNAGAWVTLSNGVWSPGATSWTYEWLIDGAVLAGLTGNRVQVRSAWSGKALFGRVTARRNGWTNGVASSPARTVLPSALKVVTAPSITGTMTLGSWVTVTNGTWEPGATGWRYEWRLDGAVVDGLTGNRVQVRSAWAGRTLSARVTASRSGWLPTASVTRGRVVV